jgi:hypothetical protein
MKTIADISYENRVHIMTLYKRLSTRGIPFEYVDGVKAVDEKYIPSLLKEGQKGRRLSREDMKKLGLDRTP